MIFQSVSDIKNKREKDFFTEKVLLYIRIIECLSAEVMDTSPEEIFLIPKDISNGVVEELKNIGVIETRKDLPCLKKILTPTLFVRFISSVELFLSNPEIYNPWINKLRNRSRIECRKNILTFSPTVVDFFCGAGGMSLGFSKSGYNILLANDIVEECLATYTLNHPEIPQSSIINMDIRELCNKVTNFLPYPVDVVIGGPPCQGFSSANQQRIIDDPRNELYKYFLKAVEEIAPKIVVMENVKGMLSVAQQVVEDYRNIKSKVKNQIVHYEVSYQLVNSADFDVAQNRIRLIYIAVRSDIVRARNITPENIFEGLNKRKKPQHYILKDALEYIKPLESPRIKGLTETDDEATGKKVDINPYSTSNEYLDLINDHRQIPLTFNHKARYASDTNYKIFSLLGQGEDASNYKIKGIMPYEHRLHCFKDKYFRLEENKPCRTITAHLRMDCLSHIHPTQTRTITPREAARIQSFPDDYIFMGSYLKTYMQIGNAVPVLLAYNIAETIKNFI